MNQLKLTLRSWAQTYDDEGEITIVTFPEDIGAFFRKLERHKEFVDICSDESYTYLVHQSGALIETGAI